jgi:hypothetical protein
MSMPPLTPTIDKSSVPDLPALAQKAKTLDGVAELFAAAASVDPQTAHLGRFVLHRLAKTGTAIFFPLTAVNKTANQVTVFPLLLDIDTKGLCTYQIGWASLTVASPFTNSNLILGNIPTSPKTLNGQITDFSNILSVAAADGEVVSIFNIAHDEFLQKDQSEVKSTLTLGQVTDLDADIKKWEGTPVAPLAPKTIATVTSPTEVTEDDWKDAKKKVNLIFSNIYEKIEHLEDELKKITVSAQSTYATKAELSDYVDSQSYSSGRTEIENMIEGLDKQVKQLKTDFAGFKTASAPALAIGVPPSTTKTSGSLKTDTAKKLHKKLNAAASENNEEEYSKIYQQLQDLYYQY